MFASIRKISDFNKEVFSIQLPYGYYFSTKTLSISQYINTEGQEALLFKIANNNFDDPTKEELKVFVKKDETWSEIKTDS